MKHEQPRIVVVGSLNMDLVTRTARRPERGETLLGEDFSMFVGGKGLNQAIAAARQGAQVTMVGRLGADDFGAQLRRKMEAEGIDAQFVAEDASTSTGIATIVIDGEGDNSIIVVAGANGHVGPGDVESAADAIAAADLVMLQLEVPLDAAVRAAEVARDRGTRVMLNPAPAQLLPDALLGLVDVLTPNESETQILTGKAVSDDQSAERAAAALLARGVGAAVLTLGARGALLADGKRFTHVPGYQVKVVDTTAAGDAFCGALAVQLARDSALEDAIRYANAAGALATTVLGAEPAMPRIEAVEQLVGRGSSQ
ncbi:MAG TPA: ribokinase [Roseiflexaceae bacterium]|nr:ribokinase [Roseiflexaceae bacterium]